MTQLLKNLNIKTLTREELLMLLNLFNLLRGKELIDELTAITTVIEESEELRERLEALKSSLDARKFEEKHLLTGGSIYFYKTKTKVFINPQKTLNPKLKIKLEDLLSSNFKEILVMEDGIFKSTLEKNEVFNYIEARPTIKITLILNK